MVARVLWKNIQGRQIVLLASQADAVPRQADSWLLSGNVCHGVCYHFYGYVRPPSYSGFSKPHGHFLLCLSRYETLRTSTHHLVEETVAGYLVCRQVMNREALPYDLSSDVFPSSLLVVHDPGRSGQDDVPELTRRQQLNHPFLKVCYSNVVSWRDDACFVDTVAEFSYP